MRTNIRLYAASLLITLFLAGCCGTHTERYEVTLYDPIYKSFEEIRNGVENKPARDLENPGKIYVYSRYLFINEPMEGIHVIDNSNPSAPQNLAFIEIPGNGDIAIRNNILYADSYVDLIALDISDPTNATEVKRIESLFPNPLDPNGQYVDAEKGVLVGYNERDTIIEYTWSDCDDNVVTYGGYGRGMEDGAKGGSGGGTQGPGSTDGVGGSMARFTMYSDYLYIVDRSNLQTIDISTPSDPSPWAKTNIGWDIETIFPYKDKLFIGSMSGMYIFDNSVPWNPQMICEFRHASACDPVVANDKYAYVTLRSGTRCQGFSNQLDIIDISDLYNPELIATYPMQGPLGLGLDGETLFICDGLAGLKVFNVKDPEDIKILNWQKDIDTYDIIPLGSSAIMIGDDGLYQYDYSDPANLRLLSVIPVKK